MADVTPIGSARPAALEFFAGIGLARLGLERAGFRVSWANDYEPDKRAMYTAQFADRPGEHTFALGDVGRVEVDDLPVDAALAWASSPCTDLSLAGGRAGLAGAESGSFWHVVRLLTGLCERRPRVVVLENVVGLATSHGGDDLTAAITAFNGLGYSVDVLALDARRFLPQSRPRLFLVGAQQPPADTPEANPDLRPDWLQWVYGDTSLRTHRAPLPAPPAPLTGGLGDVVEQVPLDDGRWWDEARTEAFVASLSPTQRSRVAALRRAPGVRYRTAYRRTRHGVAVWEVRPDDIAGCLRTARGGSSKQAVVRLGGSRLRVRWMTPREYARLMGAGDYDLSAARTNQALFGFGDAVAVPVVEWLARHYLMPLVRGELAPRSPAQPAAASLSFDGGSAAWASAYK
ncbi:DNA cytosine methyltransferase [Xylanimonas ulmi]|uniref:DNA (cytosine-5-)-methyltransferase n=1 Tax=Xylanimonas ulmi TaxID=228973 RepID=A0A4V2EYE0_9MICO|nr:DNA (cytosine-5-)-methyltransferase [Xylanibacterium ulmi]RZS62660.1 DNA (cytosine-5)-methyltransferase 1 [Xylanibacterium ulmi]